VNAEEALEQIPAIGPEYYKWRQGSVVPDRFVRGKGWLDDEGIPFLAIVATHDCDCVADCEREPQLEILLGRKVEKADGSLVNAKSTRKLHLSFSHGVAGANQFVELTAIPKTPLAKSELAGVGPDEQYALDADNSRVLRNWLRARYDRASFPNEFMRRLEAVQEKIEKITKKAPEAVAVHGIYMYHDPDGEISDSSEPYYLDIAIVFNTRIEGSEYTATSVAAELKEAFERRYKTVETQSAGIQWESIELGACEPIADLDFSFASLMAGASVQPITAGNRPHSEVATIVCTAPKHPPVAATACRARPVSTVLGTNRGTA
jgi:hypothetical protein